MKNLITILLLVFLPYTTFSQITPNMLTTKEEQSDYLYEIINDYRESKGLKRLILDTLAINACKHHSIYMSFYDVSGHFETKKDSSHLLPVINAPESRATNYGVVRGSLVGENSANLSDFIVYEWGNDPKEFSTKWVESLEEGKLNYKHAAEFVLSAWKYSKGHHSLLIHDQSVSGGAYMRVYENSKGDIRIAATYYVTDYYPGVAVNY